MKITIRREWNRREKDAPGPAWQKPYEPVEGRSKPMAVQAEGSPHSVTYLYVVGGEDYVFREVKRRLLKLGINVVGHAAYRWKNAQFEVPKLTTAILVVTDECRNDMREQAKAQGKRWEIPVLEAPAREHWGRVEEALGKAGLLDTPSGAVAPAESLASQRTTLGEVIAAKGESLEPKSVPEEKSVAAKKGTPHRELAEKYLRETKGQIGDATLGQIISKETGTECSGYFVKQVRKAIKAPDSKRGLKSEEMRKFLAEHGVKVRTMDEARTAMSKSHGGPGKPRAAKADRRPRAASDASVEKELEPEPSDDAIERAFRGAVHHLDEVLVQPFSLTTLTISLKNGQWQEPEFERVQVKRGKVKLK